MGNVYNMPRTALPGDPRTSEHCPYIVDFITGPCSNTFDIIIKDPEHRLNRLIQFSGPSRYATVGATGASSYLNARQIVLGTVL